MRSDISIKPGKIIYQEKTQKKGLFQGIKGMIMGFLLLIPGVICLFMSLGFFPTKEEGFIGLVGPYMAFIFALICSTTAQAIESPSNVEVPRPTSSNRMSD